MGASNNKKQQASGHVGGLNPRELAEKEAAAKRKKSRNKYILISVVIVVLVALVLLINSPLFSNGLPALTINDTEYTIADVNYYYQTAYITFYNNYGSYISLFFDPSVPLEDQPCSISEEEMSWADYFRGVAVDNLRMITASYEAAVEAGYGLTEEQAAAIDQTIGNYKLQAESMGYSLDAFLVLNFGEGNNEKNVRENLACEMISTQYLSDQMDSFTYTDEELDSYYAENSEDFDTVDYSYAYIAPAAGEDVDPEAAAAEAAEKAESIVDTWAEGDEAAFAEAVVAVTEAEPMENVATVTGLKEQFGDSVPASLEAGSVFSFESSGSWYVVYIDEVNDCLYPTVDVRHILAKAVDSDEDGVFSEEEKQAAYDRITELRDDWLAGAATEETFTEMATMFSEDEGSKANGGLYEQIFKGRMVEEFDEFCFAGHEPGDYDIVYGETSGYAGYHLIYFVGENELFSRLQAENAMRSQDYRDFCDELVAPYEAVHGMMWRYVMP